MSRRDANTTKVFVGSLPAAVTTDDLKQLFAPYGKIVECDIANRCGFLHLEDKDLALKAIEELNNTTFMGGKISVEKGRVKPPKRNREAGKGARERGGPYARNDGFGRVPPPPRNPPLGGGYGREYGVFGDRYGEYDRGVPMRSYAEYDSLGERRPIYDERRGVYMDDRRAYGPLNGYDRRPYDERSAYDDRGAYDDRRFPPPPPSSYDDRRPLMGNGRPLQSGVTRGPPMAGYERGATTSDMYSRRSDYGSKTNLPPPADAYSTCDPSLGYDASAVAGGAYPPAHDASYTTAVTVGYSGGDATYGTNPGYTTGEYDSRNQTAGYSTAAGSYATAGYAAGSAAYGTAYANAATAYSVSGGGYGDAYSATRAAGTYDTTYQLPPQPRSFASGTGGPGPRADMPPGTGHRF